MDEGVVGLVPGGHVGGVRSWWLAAGGALVGGRSLEEACERVDRSGPGQLGIATRDPAVWAERIGHAGAMFLGAWSSESLGDYCAGPNHVLPTMRTARFSSPLGVYDFQKRSSLIHISAAGAAALGPVASVLARGEGLQAHALGAEYRAGPGAAAGAAAADAAAAGPAAVSAEPARPAGDGRG